MCMKNAKNHSTREWEEIRCPKDLVTAKRRIDLLVVHCSATRQQDRYLPPQLIHDHKQRGFSTAGYHYYITRDGRLYALRHVDKAGAHAIGYNAFSIGICYEGGLDSNYRPHDTRTPQQRQMLAQLVWHLRNRYPTAMVVGHRDLSPDRNGDGSITPDEWLKVCPCFDAQIYN